MNWVGAFLNHHDREKRPPDVGVARIATEQHGVISRCQLTGLGVGAGSIQRRLEAGRLHRIHQGVYAVGHSDLTGRGRWMAAVLACGEGALLSHRSAAALWELLPTTAAGIDVTGARTIHRQRRICVHRPRRFDSSDRTIRDGIPVTTVARTLLDLAEAVSRPPLERAFEAAERLALLDLRAVEGVLDRARGRRGRKHLASIAMRYREQPVTRSQLERRFLDLCRDASFPLPAVNASVAGFEVDVLWPAQRLIVELDGYEFHRTRLAFERDRLRDAELQLAGYRIVRVTHRRLIDEPRAVATSIRRLLGSDQARGLGDPAISVS
jgi:very-short-patch-repair endonuclease